MSDITKQFDTIFTPNDKTMNRTRRLKTEEDHLMYGVPAIEACSHPLSKLWRLIAYKLGITKKAFKEGLRDYNLSIGKSESDTSVDWNNLQKALFGDTMTCMTFQKVILINKLNLKDITITIDDQDGNTHEFKLSDTDKLR